MELALTVIGVLVAWRLIGSVAFAILCATLLSHFFTAFSGFSSILLVLAGLGFGLIWQGRWLSGIPLFASVPSPPISKPVAFLGFAFIGAIWGGFASEMLGSLLSGVLALVAVVTLVGAWYTVVLKRHDQLGYLTFAVVSLLIGLGSLYSHSLFLA